MTTPKTPMTYAEFMTHLADRRHLQDLLDSFCIEPNCYEPRFDDDLCEEHSACNNCGGVARHCMGNCADEEDGDDWYDWYSAMPDEDPLAGDVEPTGGYYVAPPDPFEAHSRRVAAQHGDYTG